MSDEKRIFSPVTAFFRSVAFGALTLPLMAVQFVLVRLGLGARDSLPHWYHRQVCRIAGFRVVRRGKVSKAHPTLFISNHTSYFDIPVMGSLIKGSFVAKTEVGTWPLFGWLAKLQRSVFIDRQRKEAAKHRDTLVSRLESGDNLILFPEGTSNDGNRVLPFKSALFAVASLRPRGEPLTVQPVSITYTALDGMPMGRALRNFYAWYGDMELAGHLWRALGLGRATVVVQFHDPVTLEDFSSRKALADHCYRKVSEGVATALAGRPQRYLEPAAEKAPAEAAAMDPDPSPLPSPGA
ncbi:lysophospholipid acyltransferase family protein [Limibacillus halophilus]|jgi:1-acyl-sn-glycerol-3-phosphate acyltransferase